MIASTLDQDTALAIPPSLANDPMRLAAVLTVLSAAIARNRKRIPSGCAYLSTALLRYATESLPDSPARFAPDHELPVAPSDAKIRNRVSEQKLREMRDRYKLLEVHHGAEAAFSPEEVALFIPPALWEVASAWIDDGPDVAARRCGAALLRRSQHIVPARSKRTEGRVSDSTMNSERGAMKRLMTEMVNASAHSSRTLLLWSKVPHVISASGRKDSTNLADPPFNLIRLRYAQLTAEVHRRLKCGPGEELEAVASLSPGYFKGIRRCLRKWALMSLIVVTGTRADAVLRLIVDDVKLNYTSGFGTGPTLSIDPRKALEDEEFRPKPLSGAALPLLVWMAYVRRWMGRDLDPNWALFFTDANNPTQPMSMSALSTMFTGQRGTGKVVLTKQRTQHRNPHKAIAALIPLDPSNPYEGYSVHRYRASTSQECESSAAKRWLQERDSDIPSRLMSELLLDHEHITVEDGYKIGGAFGRERHRHRNLDDLVVSDYRRRREALVRRCPL